MSRFPINLSSAKRLLQFLVIGLILYFWGLHLQRNWSDLTSYQWHVNYSFFAIAFLFAILYPLSLAICWWLVLTKLGVHAKFCLAAKIWFSSIPIRYLPGTIWHFLGRVHLCSEAEIPRAKAFLSILIEQGLLVLSACLIFPIPLVLWMKEPQRTGLVPILLLIPLVFLLLYPKVLLRVLDRGLRLLHRQPTDWKFEYRDSLLLLAYYCVPLPLSGLALYSVIYSLHPLSISHLPFVVGASSVAWLIGYLAFLAPTGLGVREGIIVVLLSIYLPLPIAIAGSILWRVLGTLSETVLVVTVSAMSATRKGRLRRSVPDT